MSANFTGVLGAAPNGVYWGGSKEAPSSEGVKPTPAPARSVAGAGQRPAATAQVVGQRNPWGDAATAPHLTGTTDSTGQQPPTAPLATTDYFKK